MEKEIEITKDNYKGYLELYCRCVSGISKKECWLFVLFFYLGVLFPCFLSFSILDLLSNINSSLKIVLEIIFSFLSFGTGVIADVLYAKHYQKKRDNEFKKEFPNIDTGIYTSELRKSLERVSIIKSKSKNINKKWTK